MVGRLLFEMNISVKCFNMPSVIMTVNGFGELCKSFFFLSCCCFASFRFFFYFSISCTHPNGFFSTILLLIFFFFSTHMMLLSLNRKCSFAFRFVHLIFFIHPFPCCLFSSPFVAVCFSVFSTIFFFLLVLF